MADDRPGASSDHLLLAGLVATALGGLAPFVAAVWGTYEEWVALEEGTEGVPLENGDGDRR